MGQIDTCTFYAKQISEAWKFHTKTITQLEWRAVGYNSTQSKSCHVEIYLKKHKQTPQKTKRALWGYQEPKYHSYLLQNSHIIALVSDI